MRYLYSLILIPLIFATYSAFAEATYGGGDGTRVEDAIIIENAADHFEGVNAEYVWLETQFGPQGEKWDRSEQSLIEENDKLYDVLKVEFLDKVGNYEKGDVAYFYFDITGFYKATLEGMFEGRYNRQFFIHS